MGYELWEEFSALAGVEPLQQHSGILPDVIVYPTGGGTGLVGMHKAFEELGYMNLIDKNLPKPKFAAVQSDGCAPVVKSFKENLDSCSMWENAQTVAAGLRVPKPLADYLILRALRESHGTALTVTDAELGPMTKLIGACEGVFASPEAAATVAAIPQLQRDGFIAPDARVVLFITGGGLKYV